MTTATCVLHRSRRHTIGRATIKLQLITLYVTDVHSVSFEEDLTLTPLEMHAPSKFRRRVIPILPKSYMKHDIYLSRWLCAPNLHIQQAEQMLKSNLRWRREQNMDTIHPEDWSDMKMDYPYTSNTHDKRGLPIAAVPFAQWNVRRIAIARKMVILQGNMGKIMDEMYLRVIDELYKGNNATQVKAVFNMDVFNQIQYACPLCLPAYTNFVTTYEDRFPGGVDEVIHINTPPSFNMALNVVRPLLSPATQKALKVFGPNKKAWISYLDKEISRNARSIEYGGTKRY